MSEDYDVLVVGAGIGGLTAASILAREGRNVAVLERDDRVGGRALSLTGREINEKGANWYRGILGRHYCYLASSDPEIDSLIDDGTLDGYTLDLGFHGVPSGGKAYLGRLLDYLGIDVDIPPCDSGFHYKGEYYTEPEPGNPRLDDKLYRICKDEGIDYLSFYKKAMALSDEEIKDLDRVSLYDFCDELGMTANDVVWQSFRCVGTLFSTINNPHEISAGEMLRYSKDIAFPLISKGEELHVGGFAAGGIMKWSEAVAGELERLGGTLHLNTRADQLEVNDGRVVAVNATGPDGGRIRLTADIVISNIPIQDTFDVVDELYLDPEFVKRAKYLYGYGSLAPYFGLTDLPMPEEQAKRLVKTPAVVTADDEYDYDVYMCWGVQSLIDPTCAPEGRYLLTAYLPLTEDESRDRDKVMRVVEAVPNFLDNIYPGFRECVEWALYPMCWRLEGVAKSVSQAGTLKLDVWAPGLEGLYFAGDTALGFGVAMDCACSSGINCAATIIGREIGIE